MLCTWGLNGAHLHTAHLADLAFVIAGREEISVSSSLGVKVESILSMKKNCFRTS